MPFLCQRICSFAFLVRAKLFDAVPLHFCAGQINTQLCQAVASLRIAYVCHALPLLILAVPRAALRCSSMPLLFQTQPLTTLLLHAFAARIKLFFASPSPCFSMVYSAIPFLCRFQFSSITSLILDDTTSAASSSRAYSGGCVSPISHPSTVLLPIR